MVGHEHRGGPSRLKRRIFTVGRTPQLASKARPRPFQKAERNQRLGGRTPASDDYSWSGSGDLITKHAGTGNTSGLQLPIRRTVHNCVRPVVRR